jgi:hypothetical protein
MLALDGSRRRTAFDSTDRQGLMKRSLCLFALALGATLPAASQPSPAEKVAAPPRAEVLVLGVYHMANPGHDIFNMKADDVLAPKRQAEIAQLMEVLKRFHPTKVAVERNFGDSRIPKDYADYLAGTHELTRNEIEQVGFRLAKELGHKSVYAVDADGEFPYQHVVNYAKASGRSKELDAVMAEWGEKSKAENAYLASHTVLETLLLMNSDDSVDQDLVLYYRLAHVGEPWDWAGADLLADWFRRNIRIYSNVVSLVDSPNERVLVVFGAGHLGWLRHDFASDASLRLRKLAEFAK